jgi:hypothetical protein
MNLIEATNYYLEEDTEHGYAYYDSVDYIDGKFIVPGVYGDVVAERNKYASIYSWTGDRTGKTRKALKFLKDFSGNNLNVFDIGEDDGDDRGSYTYWIKMYKEGLVDVLHDEYDNVINVSGETK